VSYSFGTMAGRPGAWISSKLATSFSKSAALHDSGAADVSTTFQPCSVHVSQLRSSMALSDAPE